MRGYRGAAGRRQSRADRPCWGRIETAGNRPRQRSACLDLLPSGNPRSAETACDQQLRVSPPETRRDWLGQTPLIKSRATFDSFRDSLGKARKNAARSRSCDRRTSRQKVAEFERPLAWTAGPPQAAVEPPWFGGVGPHAEKPPSFRLIANAPRTGYDLPIVFPMPPGRWRAASEAISTRLPKRCQWVNNISSVAVRSRDKETEKYDV